MKNIQRIMRCYFGIIAVFFLASTAYLQAQTDYIGRRPHHQRPFQCTVQCDTH